MAQPARWRKNSMLSTTGQSCRELEGTLFIDVLFSHVSEIFPYSMIVTEAI